MARMIRRPRRVVRRKRMARKRYGLRGASTNKFKQNLNSNKMDRATVVEAQELTVVPEGGNFIQHSLQQNARALAVSKCYRFYRCKKVELEFIPYANVFAPGTAFPELYFQVDRVQGVPQGVPLPLPTKNIMLARGVVPVKWTNVVKRSYSPSVLRNENFIQNVDGANGVMSIASITATPVLYKWYATQAYFAPPAPNAATAILPTWGPQALTYFGAAYFVDQPLAAPGAILGTIKMKVHWEFKQPLWTTDSEAPPPLIQDTNTASE